MTDESPGNRARRCIEEAGHRTGVLIKELTGSGTEAEWIYRILTLAKNGMIQVEISRSSRTEAEFFAEGNIRTVGFDPLPPREPNEMAFIDELVNAIEGLRGERTDAERAS